VETAIGTLGQQQQQLDQLLAPGGCLPEHRQGLIEGPPLAAGGELLSGGHQPRTPLAFAQGCSSGGAVALIEAEAAAGLAEGDDPGRASDDGAMAMAPFVTQEALKAFTERLVESFAPEQVILFGSMARGTAGVESDADVLVVMPFEGRALDKILEIRNVCQPEFPLDMLLWRPEDIPRRYRWGDPFIREALDHGVVLYG